MEIKWKRGFRAIDRVTVEVEEALMTHEELDKYVCEEYERLRGEANKEITDLRAQLQTLREDYKEAREELQRVLGLLMGQDDKVEDLTQEKAALEAQLAASQGALSKITAEKQALWIETDRQLRELIDERAASQERERALQEAALAPVLEIAQWYVNGAKASAARNAPEDMLGTQRREAEDLQRKIDVAHAALAPSAPKG